MKLFSAIKRVFSESISEVCAPKTEIYGKKELVMTGCTRIDEFAPDTVVLSCPDVRLAVTGDGLQLVLLAKRTVAVKGNIDKVELISAKSEKNA